MCRFSSTIIAGVLVINAVPEIRAARLQSAVEIHRDGPVRIETATISGYVLEAGSKRPLRGAQVRVSSVGVGEVRSAVVDAQGRYEIADLIAGRYTVSAQKNGYVEPEASTTRMGAARSLDVREGSRIDDASFTLARGAIITGVVLDEFGEPAQDVLVSPLRVTKRQRYDAPVSGGRNAMTNDIGEFRLFGLAAGDYFISVTYRTRTPPQGVAETSYAATYFPGTTNLDAAQRISVRVSSETTGLVVSLQPVRAATVQGTAFESDGRPLNGVVTALSRTIRMPGTSSRTAHTSTDGTFRLSGLSPGSYTLFVHSPSASDEYATMDVVVDGADQEGIRLNCLRASTVKGRIVWDVSMTQKPPPVTSLRVSTMRLPTANALDSVSPAPEAVPVGDDLRFVAQGFPGRLTLTVGAPKGWGIQAVRYHGRDVTEEGLSVQPNEDIDGIEVILTAQQSHIDGTVLTDSGEVAIDYTAIIFSKKRPSWNAGQRHVSVVHPDQHGRFSADGLMPGDYYVIALDRLGGDDVPDDALLDLLRIKAKDITLSDALRAVITLPLIQMP